jgi:hypothetical protein
VTLTVGTDAGILSSGRAYGATERNLRAVDVLFDRIGHADPIVRISEGISNRG